MNILANNNGLKGQRYVSPRQRLGYDGERGPLAPQGQKNNSDSFALSGRDLYWHTIPRALPRANGLMPLRGDNNGLNGQRYAWANGLMHFQGDNNGLKGQRYASPRQRLGYDGNKQYRPERAKY